MRGLLLDVGATIAFMLTLLVGLVWALDLHPTTSETVYVAAIVACVALFLALNKR